MVGGTGFRINVFSAHPRHPISRFTTSSLGTPMSHDIVASRKVLLLHAYRDKYLYVRIPFHHGTNTLSERLFYFGAIPTRSRTGIERGKMEHDSHTSRGGRLCISFSIFGSKRTKLFWAIMKLALKQFIPFRQTLNQQNRIW